MVRQAEETKEAFIEQKQDLVRSLEQRVRDITSEIEGLETTKKNLKLVIDDAFRGKESELKAVENVLTDKLARAEKLAGIYAARLTALEKEVSDFNALKDSKLAEIVRAQKENASVAQANIEIKSRNEAEGLRLKAQDDVGLGCLGLAESLEREARFMIDQAAKRVKEVEIRENNAGIVEERQKRKEAEFAARETAQKSKDDENASLALIFSDKQDDLLALKRSLDEQKAANEKQAAVAVRDAEENLIEKKRNEIETSRIKTLTIEIGNREAKVTERENLFKPK